nr:hypothetical protein [uncultured Desulfobulbus sp.]
MKVVNVYLKNGRFVNNDFLQLIKVLVAEMIPGLVPGVGYTLKTICGDEFWNELTPGEQKQAGWCMKHLVLTGDLPLTIADSLHEYPVYYKLK